MAGGDLAAYRVAERVARDAYGRLLAALVARTRDLTLAEDVLADALEQALQHWPQRGVPAQPEAWVLAVARNRWLNRMRDAGRRPRVPLEWLDALGITCGVSETEALPDPRLSLMFACAHPAIDAGARTALMLQAVLGVQVQTMARAFLLSPATLAQRLVRAKRRLRDARIPFELPSPTQQHERLPDVLEAIYAAFALEWDAAPAAHDESLAEEARHLAQLLAAQLPREPEALGLAALIALSSARRAARHDAQGRRIALAAQDTTRWDRVRIDEGEALLRRAHALGRPGRFQIEAAIQSLHCARARSGGIDAPALLALHRALVQIAPGAGAQVALAAVSGEVLGPAQGLAELDRLDAATLQAFQPYWATRAVLQQRCGDLAAARESFAHAIALTDDAATRRALEGEGMRLQPADGG